MLGDDKERNGMMIAIIQSLIHLSSAYTIAQSLLVDLFSISAKSD
jgi:hypothetical protein